MGNGHRSYSATCLVCLLLSLFVPVWAQVIKYRLVDFNSPELLSTVVAPIAALGLFYIFGLLLSAILRLNLDLRAILDTLTYALTPLNLALWLVYGFNYAYAERLTIVTYVLTGAGNVENRFFTQLPLVGGIMTLWMLLVAYQCVRSARQEDDALPFAFALLLAPSIALSLIIGAFLGDVIRPGFFESLLKLVQVSAI